MSEKGTRIVVRSPAEGQAVGRSILVSGLSDTFEATVHARVKDANGTVLAEGHGMGGTLGVQKPFKISLQLKRRPVTPTGTVEAFEIDMRDGDEVEKYAVSVHFSA